VTKFTQWYREILLPAGLFSSLIIGAGMFALPFVFSQAGFLVGSVYLTVFTAAFIKIHRMYAEIIESNSGKHRFLGYVDIYFKKPGVIVAVFTTAIGLILALTAYIILAGEFVGLVFPGVGSFYAPYIFWILGSMAVILSLRRFATFEFLVSLAIGLIVIALFIIGLFSSRGEVSLPVVNMGNLFLPYGVVLFALSGRAAISSISDYYENRKLSKDKFHHAVTLGTLVPPIVYFIFALAVVWLSGGNISPDALSGLSHLPVLILTLVSVLGLFALWTSYFFLGLEVRDICRYDLKIPYIISLLFVIFVPITLYALGINDFIGLIGVAGGIFLAIESILVVLMYSRIKKWSISSGILVLLLGVGVIYQITSFL